MVISRYLNASFVTTFSYLFWNVHPLQWGGGRGNGPAEVHGDELVQAGGQDGSLYFFKTVSADPPEVINFVNFLQHRT
jgi:hypothetical protein